MIAILDQPPLNLYFPDGWLVDIKEDMVHIQIPWGKDVEDLKKYIAEIEERAKK